MTRLLSAGLTRPRSTVIAGIGTVIAVCAIVLGAFAWRGRPERHLARAEAAVNDGDLEAATEWLAVAEGAPSTRERAYLLRARMAVERGNLAEAVRSLDQVNPDGPNQADFAFWKGRTLYAARQPLLAIAWFRKVLSRRPGDADANRWLAAAAYDLGDRSTVTTALEAVIRLDPKDARVWHTLGMVYQENLEYEQARAAFERSLALNGSQPEVRLALAETLLKVGEPAAAERELAACRGQVEVGRRAELLADSLRMRGDIAGLRATVEAGLTDAPTHPGLLAQKAQLDLVDGRPEEALTELERAVAADPYRAQTIYQRGMVLRRLGRKEEAQRDIDRAGELNRAMEAMSRLNDQAARNPHDAEVRYQLGQLCLDLGKAELAASWYRAALACNPRHMAARLGLNALRAPRPPGNPLSGP